MPAERRETVLELSASDRVFVWVVCGGAGVALGFLLPWLLQYVAKWPIPYIEILKFLGSFDAPIMVVGRPVVLGVAGLLIAFMITHGNAILRITDAEIVVQEGEDRRVIPRELVAGVYRQGGKVHIESAGGRVLYHGDAEGGKASVAAAFVDHGYPWESVERAEERR